MEIHQRHGQDIKHPFARRHKWQEIIKNESRCSHCLNFQLATARCTRRHFSLQIRHLVLLSSWISAACLLLAM